MAKHLDCREFLVLVRVHNQRKVVQVLVRILKRNKTNNNHLLIPWKFRGQGLIKQKNPKKNIKIGLMLEFLKDCQITQMYLNSSSWLPIYKEIFAQRIQM